MVFLIRVPVSFNRKGHTSGFVLFLLALIKNESKIEGLLTNKARIFLFVLLGLKVTFFFLNSAIVNLIKTELLLQNGRVVVLKLLLHNPFSERELVWHVLSIAPRYVDLWGSIISGIRATVVWGLEFWAWRSDPYFLFSNYFDRVKILVLCVL